MAVAQIGSWAGNTDYPTNGHTHAKTAGDNRVAIVMISHEMNGGGGIGTDGSVSITWGNQTVTEAEIDWCGDPTAYHDMAFIGYLTESQVAAMPDGIVDSVTVTNGNGGIGPFGNVKIHTCYFSGVDQANILSAVSKNTTSRSASTTASSLVMGTLDTDIDEQVIVLGTSGQGASSDDFDAPAGWTQESEFLGDETNDHASTAMSRDAQTNDDTLNDTFTASTNRLCLVAVSLGAAAADVVVTGITDALVISEGTGTIIRDHLITGVTDPMVLTEGTAEVLYTTVVEGITDALIVAEGTAEIVRDHLIDGITDALVVAEGTAGIVRDHSITGITDALALNEGASDVLITNTVIGVTDALLIAEGLADVIVTGSTTVVNGITDELVLSEGLASIVITNVVTGVTDALLISEGSASIIRDHSIDGITDPLVLSEGIASVAVDHSIDGITDALLLAEGLATVQVDHSIEAITDPLILSAGLAEIVRDHLISGITDTLILTTGVANIGEDITVTGITDALSLTANSATVIVTVVDGTRTKGGSSTEDAIRIQHQKMLRKQLHVTEKPVEFDILVKEDGEVEVDGNAVPTALVEGLPSEPKLFQPTSVTQDEVTKEISFLIRQKEIKAFNRKVAQFKADMLFARLEKERLARELEEEMQHMEEKLLILLLADELD